MRPTFLCFLNSTTITFICTPAAIIGDGDSKRPKSFRGNRQSTSSGLDEDEDDSMLCKTVITRDRRYITQITCYEKGSDGSSSTVSEEANKSSSYPSMGPSASEASRLPTYGKQTQGAGAFASLFNFPSRRNGLNGGGAAAGAITSGISLGKSSSGAGSRGGGGLSMPRNRQQQQLLLTGT